MIVKELIDKLEKADKHMEVVIHDGFSVNAIEIESVVSDKNQCVAIITPQVVSDEDLDDNTSATIL